MLLRCFGMLWDALGCLNYCMITDIVAFTYVNGVKLILKWDRNTLGCFRDALRCSEMLQNA